jgi:protein-S-isoprenylcysteine O-methyltransferase Ste14
MLTMLLGLVVIVLALMQWQARRWSELVWLVAFVAMMAIRTPYAHRSRANAIVAAHWDRTGILLLAAVLLTMMVLPLVHLATRLPGFADYRLPAWATALGAVLQMPFLWLFWRSHADLDRNWSLGLEIRKDHELVTTGVYRYVRHPMYAAIWLSALTQPLLIHNWIAGALAIPAFGALWLFRTPNEEAMLRASFGDSYESYARRTGRLLPRLAR